MSVYYSGWRLWWWKVMVKVRRVLGRKKHTWGTTIPLEQNRDPGRKIEWTRYQDIGK